MQIEDVLVKELNKTGIKAIYHPGRTMDLTMSWDVDTSEHDAMVRAEIQSELMTEVAMLNETKMTEGDLKCFAYRIKAIAEQMKEQVK